MSAALIGRKMPHSLSVLWQGGTAETWKVSLDTATTYVGADLVALGQYCAANGLLLSMTVSQLGVT